MRTHIERVLWAYEFTLDATNDDAREHVARRIVNGQVFYSVGHDGRRADVETFELHGKLYIRTVGDQSKPDSLLSLDRY